MNTVEKLGLGGGMVRENVETDKLDLSPNVVVTDSDAPGSEALDSSLADPVLAAPGLTEPVLAETPQSLQSYYPKAEVIAIETVNGLEQALDDYDPSVLKRHLPSLVLVVIGPMSAVPEKKILQLLARLMHSPSVPELEPSRVLPNIVLLAVSLSLLRQISYAINAYEGGFVALRHPCQLAEVVEHVLLAQAGLVHLPEEMTHEFDRTWLEVLKLKFQEGLSDSAIARQLGVNDLAIRHYWRRIQQALTVSDDPDKDQHIQIEQAARDAELIYNKVVSLKKASFAAKKEGSDDKTTSAKVVS